MKNYVIDLLINKLNDYKDEKVDTLDISYKLLEEYNIDGSITYNVFKAQKWIKDNFNYMYDFLNNYREKYSDEALGYLALDIFNNSEKAMVIICLDIADDIMKNLDIVKNNDEIILNDENIKIIEKELEKERD